MKRTTLIQSKNQYVNIFIPAILIIVLSFITTAFTFVFSTAIFSFDNLELFKSYFQSPILLILNTLPVVLLFTIIYILTNQLFLGYFISSAIFVTMSIVNKFKLIYRDEPFRVIDIVLFKESMEMAGKYDMSFSLNMWLVVLVISLTTLALYFFANYKFKKTKLRFLILGILIIIGALSYNKMYKSESLYNKMGDKSLINIWSQTQQFTSRGFIYPFIYSTREAVGSSFDGYDQQKAIDIITRYDNSNIPNDKKVNIIAIMLEAYADFSKYPDIEWLRDPYRFFHKLQKESYSGSLVANVFGGGTIETERSFLTGYHNHPGYFRDTNSFVWYLKEQGYKTEAMHPIFGWFYNRRNVNSYLGFENFDYYENKYKAINQEFIMDYEFFDYLLEGLDKSVAEKRPYFNFTVTYQNHGPYDSEKIYGNPILSKAIGYDDYSYNIVNNYLNGIEQTDIALERFIGNLKNSDEPTVVLLFGDHKPWLGKDDSGFKMMGIDVDISTPSGLLNYYETPYVIWANPAAKANLEKEIVGEGRTISPNLLMPELFDVIGFEGNAYLKYLRDVRESISVFHNSYYKEDGEFIVELSKQGKEIYQDFRSVEYYLGNERR